MRALCALLLALALPDKILTQTNIENTTSSRIVGGTQAEVGAYPWFTALVLTTEFKRPRRGGYTVWCGASLITKNKIITAAHCYYPLRSRGGKWMSKLTAIFNLKNRCTLDFQVSSPIKKVEMHPQFNQMTIKNDIAIATLEQSISIPPVSLAPKGRGGTSSPAFIIGYGNTVQGGRTEPCKLMEVNLEIFTRTQCLKTKIANAVRGLPGALCAGAQNGGRDSCQGDSGGPLIKEVNDKLLLQGITSFGDGCGKPNSPGVYTDISYYRGWIDQKINVPRSTRRPISSLTQSVEGYISNMFGNLNI